MDREAWRAVIHGVAKSRTRLSDWTELSWTDDLKNNVVKEGDIVVIVMMQDFGFHWTVWFLSRMLMVKEGNTIFFFHFLYPKAFYDIILPALLCSPKSYYIWELSYAFNLGPYYFPWEILEMRGGCLKMDGEKIWWEETCRKGKQMTSYIFAFFVP